MTDFKYILQPNSTFLCPCVLPDIRTRTLKLFFMVVSCNRWLAVRLDLLSSIFVTIVALGAVLMTENPGEFVKAFFCNNLVYGNVEISAFFWGGDNLTPT